MVSRIKSVEPIAGRRLRLSFSNGRVGEVDLTPLLKGPVFAKIRANEDVFRRVRVDKKPGTILWPNGADLCPDVLYKAAAKKRRKARRAA